MIRRNFLKSLALAGGAIYTKHISALNEFDRKNKARTFHLSVSSGILDENPELFGIIIAIVI